MYAPRFFAGRLIARFGACGVVVAGLLRTDLSGAVGLMGVDIAHFWLTLILLGIAWNFCFIGASALVLECHRPEEKTRAQSLNDAIVFSRLRWARLHPAVCLRRTSGTPCRGCRTSRWCWP
jgi:MFS family permease